MQLRFRSDAVRGRQNCPLLHRIILQDCFSAQVDSMFCRDQSWNGSCETKIRAASTCENHRSILLRCVEKRGRSLSYALFPINGSCTVTSRSLRFRFPSSHSPRSAYQPEDTQHIEDETTGIVINPHSADSWTANSVQLILVIDPALFLRDDNRFLGCLTACRCPFGRKRCREPTFRSRR
jgi:hypothetical protein